MAEDPAMSLTGVEPVTKSMERFIIRDCRRRRTHELWFSTWERAEAYLETFTTYHRSQVRIARERWWWDGCVWIAPDTGTH